jgi:DNA-binding NarL/FixJ family response regulator
MDKLIKVLIVEDHESMSDAFVKEFHPENGFTVTGCIPCAADTEYECAKIRPDVIIMDVCTANGASGLDATEIILKKFPGVKIIVTSGFDEITYMPRAKELGAHAFVFKSKGLAHFREVAKRVAEGEYVFPEPLTIPTPQGEAPFTEREMEVLRLMCRGMNGRQIASELYITEATVKYHKANMLAKSGFSSGVDLAFHVVSHGWINPNY